MASFTNLTLNTKVYTPAYFRGDTAAWAFRGDGVAAGFSNLTQRVYQAAKVAGKLGAWHSTHKLTLPIVAVADTDCACAGSVLRESGFDVHGWFAPGSTEAERLDLYNRLVALVATDQFKETFTKLAPVISA